MGYQGNVRQVRITVGINNKIVRLYTFSKHSRPFALWSSLTSITTAFGWLTKHHIFTVHISPDGAHERTVAARDSVRRRFRVTNNTARCLSRGGGKWHNVQCDS